MSNNTVSTSIDSSSPSPPSNSSPASSTDASPLSPSSSAPQPTSLTPSASSGIPPTEPPTSSPPPVSLPPTSSPSPQPPTSSPPPRDTPTTRPSAPASPPPAVTSAVTLPPPEPTTRLITSLVIQTPTVSGESPVTSVILITSVVSETNAPQTTLGSLTSLPSSSSTSLATQPGKQETSKGKLSAGGKTAIAVVVPIVVVAALIFGGIFLWRRHKQRKNAAEARRKEVEEYNYNPNHDPTLPAVGMTGSDMAEDQSGYRGWGGATNSSNRKASTTLTSGMTGYSDSGSNPGGYQSPGSPTQAHSDAHSNDPLVAGRRETLDSDGVAALGSGPAANQNTTNIHRGPSNASSSYSAANRSDASGEYPIPVNNTQDYYTDNAYPYAANPYENSYAPGQQPVIRDVSARRNTRIETPTVYPQQGNSGIAQNF